MDLEKRLLMSNMTKAELAKKIGVSEASVGRYCKSQRMPKPDILKRIAEVFGVTMEDLLNDNNIASLKPMDTDTVEKITEIMLEMCEEKKNHAKLVYDMALGRYKNGYTDKTDLILLMEKKIILYGHDIPEFIEQVLEEIKINKN